MFDFFTKKKEACLDELRHDIAVDVERISSEVSSLGAAFGERLASLEDQLQQAQRQERRRQVAIESLLENQDKTLKKQDEVFELQDKALEILGRLEPFPPLEALMALAENFVLFFLEDPENPALLVLYGKMSNLLACFGLSLITDMGCEFDPGRHEACMARRDLSRPEDSILEVVRPGFLLKDQILRCATVVVNRYDAEPDEAFSGVHDSDVAAAQMLWEGELYD
ncbi:MAG: nucleotide exchange factor GrpE [Synergistaceae bacterium]|jgi:molecular chaperone GrpE (heat shock protein)|nr:nucleotide exchange factor GrpE [Synergistaceae bacterium]